MRIGIDYTAAVTQHAGIGRYTRSLVAALAVLDTADDLVLFSTEPLARAGGAIPRGARIHPRTIGIGGRALGNRAMSVLWQRWRVPLPVEVFTGRLDVYHAPDFTLAPSAGARTVVTIHDLAFLTHPECAAPNLVRYLSRAVPRAVRQANCVVAVSQCTADDLVALLGVPRSKITVVPLGVDGAFAPVRDAATLAAIDHRYNLAHPLVLAVGTLEPRKNFARLISAFASIQGDPAAPVMLAIAGREGWLYEGIYRAAAESEVADRIRFLGQVPDADLPALYSTADIVAVPSIYEGFGIPVLEAFACGTPVVCSSAGSLPEVAGDAALLVSPEDTDELATALLRLARDKDAAMDLAVRGQERARKFAWERAARDHHRVYHALQSAATTP